MGLDMYLSKRAKLTEEQKRRIVAIEQRIDEIAPIIDQELCKLREEAEKVYGEAPTLFSNEHESYMKSIADHMKEHVPDEIEALMEEHEDLRGEMESTVASQEIHYWRKHSNLNGFLTELYYKKGGEGEFNCRNLFLTRKDVKAIIEFESKGEEQEEHSGFFWGQSTQEDRENSIKVFTNILENFDFEKDDLIYSCWY